MTAVVASKAVFSPRASGGPGVGQIGLDIDRSDSQLFTIIRTLLGFQG